MQNTGFIYLINMGDKEKNMMKSPLNIYRKSAPWPKIINLESEEFTRALKISQKVTDERGKWQTYLNALALLGFVEWLQEQIPNTKINTEQSSIFQSVPKTITNTVHNLQVGAFKLCLIVVSNLQNESITLASNAIKTIELASHFYVLIQVLEEEAELIVHGFIRHDEIMKYHKSFDKSMEEHCNTDFNISVSYFDPEVNNLLLCTRFLKADAIPLPANPPSVATYTSKSIESLVNLGEWLGGIFNKGWQSLEDFYPPSLYWEERKSLSWGPSRGKFKHALTPDITGSKRYDLGVRLKGKKIALVIRMKPDEEHENEKDVLVQVCPDEIQQYLPQSLKLKVTLNPDSANSDSEEVVARTADNFIQLEFNESPGKQFKVEISYEELAIVEQFVL